MEQRRQKRQPLQCSLTWVPVGMGLLLVTIVSTGCTKTAPPPKNEATAKTELSMTIADAEAVKPTVTPKKTGEDSSGWYYLEEARWIPVVDKLGEHLQEARHQIAQGELGLAAENVRQGIAFLETEVARLDGNGTSVKHLKQAVVQLKQIGDKLDAGEWSKWEIDNAFADAYRADLEERWVAVTVEEWTPLFDQPDDHLTLAREYFLNGAYDNAALEIRKTVAYAEIEKFRVPGESGGQLDAAVDNLATLAEDVEHGRVEDVAKLDRAFGNIDYVLAKHHYLSAVHHWEELETASTGYAMKAAAQYLQHAFDRTKVVPSNGVRSQLDKSISIANALILGTKTKENDVSAQLDKLGLEITELNVENHSAA
jgi:hypothetical protein